MNKLTKQMKAHLAAKLRDELITGNFGITDGMKQPTNWKDYAIKLEDHLISIQHQIEEIKDYVKNKTPQNQIEEMYQRWFVDEMEEVIKEIKE